MSHSEFNQLLNRLNALSSEQIERLYRALESKRTAVPLPVASEEATAPAHKPVWERILERTAGIPDEEWGKLPTDLSEQHDHYLYGTPRRSPE